MRRRWVIGERRPVWGRESGSRRATTGTRGKRAAAGVQAVWCRRAGREGPAVGVEAGGRRRGAEQSQGQAGGVRMGLGA
jgi:hypothetical protein